MPGMCASGIERSFPGTPILWVLEEFKPQEVARRPNAEKAMAAVAIVMYFFMIIILVIVVSNLVIFSIMLWRLVQIHAGKLTTFLCVKHHDGA